MLESEPPCRFSKDHQKTTRIILRVTREKYSQLFRNFWSIGGKSKRKTESRVEEHRAVTRLQNFNPPSSLFENIRKLEQSEKMDEILGKWIFISQHGVEECLIKQNIGWIKRKLILSLAPNIIYSQPDENILRVEFQTKVKNMSRDYKWPGVTQHKGNISKFEK